MPTPVTFLNIGGNHADQEWAKSIADLAKSLHASGVPLTLAVENGDHVNAQQMVLYKAQLLAELQLHKNPNLMEGSYGDSVVKLARSLYKEEIKELQPYLPEPGSLNGTQYEESMSSFIERIDAYEQELSLYQYALEHKIDVCGLESSEGRQGVSLDNVGEAEAQRIQGMTKNGLKLIESQLQKGGGVILTTDLGQAHTSTLALALAAKTSEKAASEELWKQVKISNVFSNKAESKQSMIEAAAHLEGGANKLSSDQAFYQNIGGTVLTQLNDYTLESSREEHDELQSTIERLSPEVKRLELEITEIDKNLGPLLKERDDLLEQAKQLTDADEVLDQYDKIELKCQPLENQKKVLLDKLDDFYGGLRTELTKAERQLPYAKQRLDWLSDHATIQKDYMLAGGPTEASNLKDQLPLLKERHSSSLEVDLSNEVKPNTTRESLKSKEVDPLVLQQREERKRQLLGSPSHEEKKLIQQRDRSHSM